MNENGTVLIHMDIPVQLESLMKNKIKKAKEDLFHSEFISYKKAIEDCIGTLKELLETDDDKEFVIHNDSIGNEQIIVKLTENIIS